LRCSPTKVLVLDTAAFIARLQLRIFCVKMVTPPRVLEEVKDFESRMGIALIEGLDRVVVREPHERSRQIVRMEANKLRLLKKLSETDVDVLALALEEKNAGIDVIVVTDDYAVQAIAKSMGMSYAPVKTVGIDGIQRRTGSANRQL